MECINTYLLKDGPNIGSQAMDIHSSLQDFVFHFWLTTHDKGLKVFTFIHLFCLCFKNFLWIFLLQNCLINYAKLQLKLNRISEGGTIIEQLLLVFDKELNQNIIGTIGIPKLVYICFILLPNSNRSTTKVLLIITFLPYI